MPRVPRRQSATDIYHVYLRGSGRQLIYEDDRDCRVFLHALALAAKETDTQLYAYVLMGNHYHLIVKSAFPTLPVFAHKLNCTYAVYFNERHDRLGHLFEGRYKSQPINDELYFLEAIRYVHRNPVVAHIAPDCNYPWSSYADYLPANAKNNQVVSCKETVSLTGHPEDQPLVRPTINDTSMVLDMLGSAESFQFFHTNPCKAKLADDCPDRASMTEADMIAIARNYLQDIEPGAVKTLPKSDRDRALRYLKLSMLTKTQIALITGLSLSTVSRA